MKIHDFGLWFQEVASEKWSITVPQKRAIYIYYDGHYLGEQWSDFVLTIYDDEPYMIMLKSKLPVREGCIDTYAFGRRITLDDFEIVKNPDYRGDQ